MSRFTAASDWEKLSAEFSKWLPLIAPYGERLISLAAPTPGMRVLDLACGTGEPGLTLARQAPKVEVIGADQARSMAHAAHSVRRTERLDNIRFGVTRGEQLPFPDSCFDRVICRFGMMLFDDPVAGVAEIFRVTKSGGQVALAVWAAPEHVLCPTLTLQALERFTPVEWPRTFSLSKPGQLVGMCEKAGFTTVTEATFDPAFTFDDLAHFMERNLTGRFIEEPMIRLSESERMGFVAALGDAAVGYEQPDGTVRLPQRAIIVGAAKP